MNDRETRRRLEDWDPAAGVEAPNEELYAGIRSRLAAAPPTPRRPAQRWPGARWATAAVAVAGTLLVAVTLVRLARPGIEVASPAAALETDRTEPAPVQVVYTASNGVRIYWSVPAADASRM